MTENTKVERQKRFDQASDIFSEESKKLESVNLAVKPLTLFFIREALMNLVEISMSKRGVNDDNDLMLLYKCEGSLEVINEVEKIIIKLSPNFEEFFRKSKRSLKN